LEVQNISIAHAKETHSGLDILFNNVGIPPSNNCAMREMPVDAVQRVMQVKFTYDKSPA